MSWNDPIATGTAWWRTAVTYQIYVRSFADSDGDGVGDLPGITGRLPYLRDLGVDAVWLTPFYTSPQHDHGYDVADYYDVDPLFGDLDAADRAARDGARPRAQGDRGPRPQPHLERPRVVPGRRWPPGRAAASAPATCSARGAARTAASPPTTGSRSSAARRGPGSRTASGTSTSSTPPSPTSTGATPRSPRCSRSVLRFWLDRGVDGFRVDVAHGLVKEEGLRDQRGDADRGPLRRDGRARARRRADVGPARGPRRLPAVAPGPRRVRRRPDGGGRGVDPDHRVDGALRAARRALPDLQLRLAARRLVGAPPSPRSSAARWPRCSRSAPPRPGC